MREILKKGPQLFFQPTIFHVHMSGDLRLWKMDDLHAYKVCIVLWWLVQSEV